MVQRKRTPKDVFSEALDLSGEGREAYLDSACAGDAALRAKVDELLAIYEGAARFLSSPTSPDESPAGAVGALEQPGTRIGRYRLLEPIGEGGFGIVYIAEQEEPVRRRVALKVIKLGIDSKSAIARFETERQVLAWMDHPNIAKILDGGTTRSGRPYFVMELIRGEPITAYCDQHRLAIAERLDLFVQACDAVQHAHQKGIIHRDIKPANILVGQRDGCPDVKVLDFGIAKATDPGSAPTSGYTEQRALIGTPEYMSPEQAEASADIDTRTDVYSLGVLLYEMLTGGTPLDAQRLRSSTFADIQRILREEETEKPSTRLLRATDAVQSVAAVRRTDARRLGQLVRGDLDWIVMRCLEKDRQRRYESASALAADVRRHLSREPVVAAPPSAAYRWSKFVRRHRVGVAAATVGAVVLALGATGTTLGMFWAVRASDRVQKAAIAADRQRDKAVRVAGFMRQTLEGVGPAVSLGRDTAMLREMMGQAAARIAAGELDGAPQAEQELRVAIGRTYRQLSDYDAAAAMLAPALELAVSNYGEESEECALVLSEQAQLHFDRGLSATEALEFEERALAIRRRLFTGDHESVAFGLSAAASFLERMGRASEALPKFTESLEMYQRLFPSGCAPIANVLDGLAGCLESLGRPDEALARRGDALEMSRAFLSPNHPDVAARLNNLGFCLEELGRVQEALPRFEAALEIHRRVLPADHPDIATSLNNVAYALDCLGRGEDALAQYEAALALLKLRFHGDHEDVALYENNVARCLQGLGRTSEALARAQGALEMIERMHPSDDHELVTLCSKTVAGCLVALRRAPEALPKFMLALEMSQRLSAGASADVAVAFNDVGFCLNQLGRPAEALPYLQDAVAMYQRVYAGDHPSLATALESVATTQQSLGNAELAESTCDEALQMRRRLANGDDPALVVTLNRLARLQWSHRRVAEAEAGLVEALQMCRRMYTTAHAQTALVLHHLAEIFSARGALGEAEPLAHEADELYRAHPEWPLAEHMHAAGVLFNVLVAGGRATEAAEVARECVDLERSRPAPDDAALASCLAECGQSLLSIGTPEAAALAEPFLRECEELRRRLFPDGDANQWRLFNAMSLLGGALLTEAADSSLAAEHKLDKLREAELFLLDAHHGFEETSVADDTPRRDVIERLGRLYAALDSADPGAGHDLEAANWRALLGEPTTKDAGGSAH